MVEFCDICGSLLFHVMLKGGHILKCACGWSKEFTEDLVEGYILNKPITHSKGEESFSISQVEKWKKGDDFDEIPYLLPVIKRPKFKQETLTSYLYPNRTNLAICSHSQILFQHFQ